MSEWYLKTGTEELGPFSAAEMRSKAQTGELCVDTPVRRSSDDCWTTAGRMKGLFPTGSSRARAAVSASTKPPAPPPRNTSYSNPQNIFLLACVGVVFVLTLVNAILIIANRPDTQAATVSVTPSRDTIDARTYDNLAERLDAIVSRIEENERLVDQLADKINAPQPDPAEIDPDVDRLEFAEPSGIATTKTPETPRDAFLAEVIKRDWTESYHTELVVGGKTVRSNNLDVRVDKILRSDDRWLQLASRY